MFSMSGRAMEGDTRMLSFFHGAARLMSMQASIPKLDVLRHLKHRRTEICAPMLP
jgi:hypothetical protein